MLLLAEIFFSCQWPRISGLQTTNQTEFGLDTAVPFSCALVCLSKEHIFHSLQLWDFAFCRVLQMLTDPSLNLSPSRSMDNILVFGHTDFNVYVQYNVATGLLSLLMVGIIVKSF